MLNSLPAPAYDEDKPLPTVPVVKNPSTTAPQVSSTGLFIPYTINKKQQQKKTTTTTSSTNQVVGPTKNDSDIEDDDDNDQTDFLGLTKSNQIQITNTDVESVLRETFPKARPTVVEQPILPSNPMEEFDDLDDDQQGNYAPPPQNDDEEVNHSYSSVFRFSFSSFSFYAIYPKVNGIRKLNMYTSILCLVKVLNYNY